MPIVSYNSRNLVLWVLSGSVGHVPVSRCELEGAKADQSGTYQIHHLVPGLLHVSGILCPLPGASSILNLTELGDLVAAADGGGREGAITAITLAREAAGIR